MYLKVVWGLRLGCVRVCGSSGDTKRRAEWMHDCIKIRRKWVFFNKSWKKVGEIVSFCIKNGVNVG
ncbi:hypothetical protein HanXRQr2_Chr10g0436091 [Helianthus annuus]|uniref:Uncharacterized protein n=1 Tax=Helianthus annuus TaxID=4232 RepID=A0A9K3HWR0_HELAN|nr:hypothetical protein HanXRQr2_Chr10g0436091 [Helianthus annuus]KAJ0883407.1 hypothetical protein HanPSC8_Chr10g0421151 [Helianthus annuus]